MSFINFLMRGSKKVKLAVCAALLAVMTVAAGFVSVRHIYVVADGRRVELMTMLERPERILQQAEVVLGPKDEYRLSTKKIEDKTEITVYRAVEISVEFEGKVKKVTTAKPTVGEVMKELGYDREKFAADPGAEAAVCKDQYILIYDKTKAPAVKEEDDEDEGFYGWNDSYQVRGNHIETSRGTWRFTQRLEMEATAYTPYDGDGNCITASGLVARYGIVAVDPDVIPLGTRLYIPGYGMALAADTGGAIIGDIVDLCMETEDECMEFGRRDVVVYVLEG